MHLKNSGVFEQLSTTLGGGSHLVESKGLTPDNTEDGLYTRRTQQTITILPIVTSEDANTMESNTEQTDATETANQDVDKTADADQTPEATGGQADATEQKDEQ